MAPDPHPDCETTFVDPANPNVRIPFPNIVSDPSIDLSVIVPAYNEKLRLPSMLDETLTYLESRRTSSDASHASKPFAYELIVVDDGSSDCTAEVVLRYVSNYSTEHVRLLQMRKNVGKGAAVRRGVLSARGRYILMADADAATVFEDLEMLEQAVAAGSDVAIGSRAHLRSTSHASSARTQREMPASEKRSMGRDILRSFVSFVFNLFVVYIGGVSGLRDTQCGFKLFSRRAARIAFEGQHLQRWAFDVENLYRVQTMGMSIIEVPIRWTEVPGSKLSVVRAAIRMACDMVWMRYRYVSGGWNHPSPDI